MAPAAVGSVGEGEWGRRDVKWHECTCVRLCEAAMSKVRSLYAFKLRIDNGSSERVYGNAQYNYTQNVVVGSACLTGAKSDAHQVRTGWYCVRQPI